MTVSRYIGTAMQGAAGTPCVDCVSCGIGMFSSNFSEMGDYPFISSIMAGIYCTTHLGWARRHKLSTILPRSIAIRSLCSSSEVSMILIVSNNKFFLYAQTRFPKSRTVLQIKLIPIKDFSDRFRKIGRAHRRFPCAVGTSNDI